MGYGENNLLAWLLQNLLDLSREELGGSFEVSRFTVFLYPEPWFRSPFIVDAAYLDLHTFKNLDEFEK